MSENDKLVLIYATHPSVEVVCAVGQPSVEHHRDEGINIQPAMTTMYPWNEAIQSASESVLIINTLATLADDAITDAKTRHPSAEPAVLILPISGGSRDFIDWIANETRPPAQSSP